MNKEKPWKPKNGERIYMLIGSIDSLTVSSGDYAESDKFTKEALQKGLVFKTEYLAEQIIESIYSLLENCQHN